MDSAYQAKYLGIARLLWQASEGDPASIPANYCEHLNHEYVDGDISLVSLLAKFESFSELEDYEVEEAIEMLGKVSPEDWPNSIDIEGVSVEDLLKVYDENACEFKNEDECEEELDEEGKDIEEVEIEHFDEKDDLKSGETEI